MYVFKYFLCCLSFLLTYALQAQSIPFSTIDQVAEKYVKKKKNKTLMLGIISGEKRWINSYGQLTKSDTTKANAHTLFEIGELTQLFTASQMVYQANQGQFNLEEAVRDYLPDGIALSSYRPFDCMEVLMGPDAPTGVYHDYPPRMVTCYPDDRVEPTCIGFCDLATHTSGLPNNPKGLYSWNPFKRSKQKKDPYRHYSQTDLYEHLNDYDVVIPPGRFFKKSDLGMALLGNVLGEIAGKPYWTLIAKNITEPLEMSDTRFELTEEQQKRLATGHNKKGRATNYWHFDAMAPAGGLKSSIHDLMIFLKANMGLKEGELDEAFRQAQQARIIVENKKQKRMTLAGYGWMSSTLKHLQLNLSIVWMEGATGGFRSFIAFDKDLQHGLVLLSNSANDLNDMGFEILELLNKEKMPLPEVAEK